MSPSITATLAKQAALTKEYENSCLDEKGKELISAAETCDSCTVMDKLGLNLEEGIHRFDSNIDLLLAGKIGEIYLVAAIPLIIAIIIEISWLTGHFQSSKDNRLAFSQVLGSHRLNKLYEIHVGKHLLRKFVWGIFILTQILLIGYFAVMGIEIDRKSWCVDTDTRLGNYQLLHSLHSANDTISQTQVSLNTLMNDEANQGKKLKLTDLIGQLSTLKQDLKMLSTLSERSKELKYNVQNLSEQQSLLVVQSLDNQIKNLSEFEKIESSLVASSKVIEQLQTALNDYKSQFKASVEKDLQDLTMEIQDRMDRRDATVLHLASEEEQASNELIKANTQRIEALSSEILKNQSLDNLNFDALIKRIEELERSQKAAPSTSLPSLPSSSSSPSSLPSPTSKSATGQNANL